MTDDLVKRLRDKWQHSEDGCYEAADRIEVLEKEVEDWKKRCLSTFVEMVMMLADTAAEKANIRAIFSNPEDLFKDD